MCSIIRRLTSLSNLGRYCNPKGQVLRDRSGQVATLLILLTVILLMFTLVTLNIGNVSMTSTYLSNAADSAALYLGSQLATQARQIYDSIGFKQCQATGFLSLILAAVIAIIAVVLVVTTAGAGIPAIVALYTALGPTLALMVIGAVAGAIGGAIGGAIAGTGAAQGALSGACIGAAIGGIGAGIAGLANATWSSGAIPGAASGTTALAPGAAFAPAGTAAAEAGLMPAVPMGAGGVVPTSLMGSFITPAATNVTSTLVLGALSGAGTGYNENINQSLPGDIANEFMKQMGEFSDASRLRESTFFRALSLAVDDPTRTIDYNDADKDDDRNESLLDFQRWFAERLNKIHNIEGGELVNYYLSYFLNQSCKRFQDYANVATEGDIYWDYGDWGIIANNRNGILERQDYKLAFVEEPDPQRPGQMRTVTRAIANPDGDGSVVKLLRGLWDHGIQTTFWRPGPTPEAVNQMADQINCGAYGEAGPPELAGYDEVDWVADTFRDMAGFIAALRSLPEADTISSWRNWAMFLYDEYEPDSPGTYYVQLKDHFIPILRKWKQELADIRSPLPECVMDYSGPEPFIANPPCKWGFVSGSIDANVDDDFGDAFNCLGLPGNDENQSVYELRRFVYDIRDYFLVLYDTDETYYGAMCIDDPDGHQKSCGGKNPVTYTWDDSRGHHWVRVKTVFRPPRTVKKKYGNFLMGEICICLVDHQDDSHLPGEKCHKFNANPVEVIVTRHDSSVSMGKEGFWNPFGGTITKASRVSFGIAPGGSSWVRLRRNPPH